MSENKNNYNNEVEELDINHLMQIRRDKLKELQEQGKKLVEQGNKKHENQKIDKNKMSIMLFTSGTTSEPKAVMLSQDNICSDVSAIACHVKLYPTDTLLSFLPLFFIPLSVRVQ